MSLRIHNSLSGQKELFEPLQPGRVGIYVCGMTVYDHCHLGHARVLVAFDVITRYLRHLGYRVHYVRNITDVDDKIIRRAEEGGEPCEALTERFIAAMHEDEARLGVQPPDEEPRATAHMADIIAMIETLVEKDYAYVADNGDVYFRVARFSGYGKLTNRSLDEMRAGARVEVNEAKEDPCDFVLWKASRDDSISWDAPWGPGRPGWHIECSAMSRCCLGNTFDIHGGGPDLPFPHHENEIAQSEAANDAPFVNTWMHAGAVRVNQEKMSKSLGNFFTIREILETQNPEVVRYFLVMGHYRSQIDYSPASLQEARRALDRFYQALRGLESAEPRGGDAHVRRFQEAMEDDFNTPEALAVLFDLVREINRLKATDAAAAARQGALLKKLGAVLGLLQQDPEAYFKSPQSAGENTTGPSDAEIEQRVAERTQAKKARDFARADAIRDELHQAGVVLEDNREGTLWRRLGPGES